MQEISIDGVYYVAVRFERNRILLSLPYQGEYSCTAVVTLQLVTVQVTAGSGNGCIHIAIRHRG